MPETRFIFDNYKVSNLNESRALQDKSVKFHHKFIFYFSTEKILNLLINCLFAADNIFTINFSLKLRANYSKKVQELKTKSKLLLKTQMRMIQDWKITSPSLSERRLKPASTSTQSQMTTLVSFHLMKS